MYIYYKLSPPYTCNTTYTQNHFFSCVILNTRHEGEYKNCYNNKNRRGVLVEHLQFINHSLFCPYFLHQQTHHRTQQYSKPNCSYLETDET